MSASSAARSSITWDTGPLPPDELERRRVNRSIKAMETWAIKKAEKDRDIRQLHTDLADLQATMTVAESQLNSLTGIEHAKARTQIRLAASDSIGTFLRSVTHVFDLFEANGWQMRQAMYATGLQGLTISTVPMAKLGELAENYFKACLENPKKQKTTKVIETDDSESADAT
jgi:hypothetical protein